MTPRYVTTVCALLIGTLSCTNQAHRIGGRSEVRGILYDSNRTGTTEIYRLDADGTESRITSPSDDRWAKFPDWSPDGKSIVFQAENDSFGALWIMDETGKNRRLLASEPGHLWNPAWSPDGDLIAFNTDFGDSTRIKVVDRDGGNKRLLVSAISAAPTWSRDGQELAFLSIGDGSWNVFLVGVDGSRRRQLTHFKGLGVGGPSWSPDGRLLAFDSPEAGDWNIYVIRPDGTGLRRVTESSGNDARPSWSCDGQWIAFHSDRHFLEGELEDPRDGFEIYVIRPDGTGARRLTTNTANDAHPDWC